MTTTAVRKRQGHGRLLACQALVEPVEMTEADALARLAEQEDAERSAMDGSGDWPTRRDWTPAEIGGLVIAIGRSMSYGEIADALDKSEQAVASKLAEVRRWLGKRRWAGKRKGAPAHRPRSVTPAQEERIAELRLGGASVAAIAEDVGCSEGAVRYVLYGRRGDDGN